MTDVRVRALNTFMSDREGHRTAGDEFVTDQARALELQKAGNVEVVDGDFRKGAEDVAEGDGGDTRKRAEPLGRGRGGNPAGRGPRTRG